MVKREYTSKDIADGIKEPKNSREYYEEKCREERAAITKCQMAEDYEGERKHKKKWEIYTRLILKVDPPGRTFLDELLDSYREFTFIFGFFLISLIFSSPNIMGNSIGNLSINTSSFIGFIFFILGLIGVFFRIKNRKKK